MPTTKKKIIAGGLVGAFFIILFAGYYLMHASKTNLALSSLSVFQKASVLLPIHEDTKKAIQAANDMAQAILKEDGVTRRYLVLLQNNYELRPGGGFLGQYAVVTLLNGEIQNLYLEDANLLDQRITAKIDPPYPFERMMQIKNWKFRDSNFSPDYPTNVEKALYFYRLSGGNANFDGVIAVNATVMNDLLAITGPIQVPGYSPTFTSEDGALVLEEVVEKAYLGEDVPAELKQNRKNIMKRLAAIMADKLVTPTNIPKLIDVGRKELENKNVMLYFEDPALQARAEEVYWAGKVAESWEGDYLMVVDANLGALKTDYFIDRKIEYQIDVTGEKPLAKVIYTYTHNATYGDWRTSDYHSYMRLYVPQGSNLLDRKMVSYPNIQEEFGKTYFGFIAHTLINDQTVAEITYELPERFMDVTNYELLVQKQSGAGDIPFSITIITPNKTYSHEEVLTKDLKYRFEEEK